LAARLLSVAVLFAGCGRLGFDDSVAGGGGGGGGSGSSTHAPSMDGLVAYWDFETLTATGADSVVSTDTAECTTGECPQTTAGVTGNAAAFDGATTCLHVPSLINWFSPQFTMSAWVQVQTMTDNPIVMRDPDGCSSPSIRGHATNIGFLTYDDTATHQEAWTSTGFTMQEWRNVAVRWDGTAQMVFLDGRCACNIAPPKQVIFAPIEFTLGCDPYDGTRISGALDEVRIYDRALSDAEMADLVAVGGRAPAQMASCSETCMTVQP
jgi:hypothetical protein